MQNKAPLLSFWDDPYLDCVVWFRNSKTARSDFSPLVHEDIDLSYYVEEGIGEAHTDKAGVQ
jgi:hypothetical protein